jgi:type IV fimbrial biogenesis protein FimT
MQAFGFFIPRSHVAQGFTSVELLLCLGLLAILSVLAMPHWQRAQERSRVEAARDQLMNDLQSARIRALQRGEDLQMARLRDCTWGTSSENDWSCGWQLVTKTSQTTLHTSQLQIALQVTFSKSLPLPLNPRGDLGTVGDRWVIKSRNNTLNIAHVVCVNSASRLRWQSGESCS